MNSINGKKKKNVNLHEVKKKNKYYIILNHFYFCEKNTISLREYRFFKRLYVEFSYTTFSFFKYSKS